MRPGGTRVRRATPPAAVSAVLKRGAREDCPVEGVESGWARFKGWELEWNDVSGFGSFRHGFWSVCGVSHPWWV